MRKSSEPESPSQAIYDGREWLGTICRKGNRYLALDCDGRRLGLFDKNREAFDAILAIPSKKDGGAK